jgi:hypothetical protein
MLTMIDVDMLVGHLKEEGQLEDLDVGGRITPKWLSKEWNWVDVDRIQVIQSW